MITNIILLTFYIYNGYKHRETLMMMIIIIRNVLRFHKLGSNNIKAENVCSFDLEIICYSGIIKII